MQSIAATFTTRYFSDVSTQFKYNSSIQKDRNSYMKWLSFEFI